MHEYPFDVTTVRLAVIVGVIASILFYERIQLTTGGAIVPGYLALFFAYPLFIAMTLVNGYLTYYVVNQIIAKRRILYGRRKFEVEILTALVLLVFWTFFLSIGVRFSAEFAALTGVGYVLAAVIAHDMFRQTPRKTIIAILANVAIVGLFVYLFTAVMQTAPWYTPGAVPTGMGALGYPLELLVPAIIASVLSSMALYAKLGLRTGGFVSGAYLALMLLRPADLLFAFAVAVVTYYFVAHLLMNHVLIFGRRKMGMMVLWGAIFAWTAEIGVTLATGGGFVPWRGFHVITLMIPALIANDAQRQGLYRTTWGAMTSAVAVFTAMNFVEAIRGAW